MWFISVILFFVILHNTHAIECDHTKTECEIWLTIEEKLTMTWGKVRVYAENGTLYRFDETPGQSNTKIPIEEVITMDGYPRSVVSVNGTVPGPPIVAYEDQTLIIHVKNNLISKAITIHWHGLHMRETPFMDGVAFITQCPINAGQTFTYKFKAYPSGTSWYHSHIGGQRVDGLFGAFIIKRKSEISNGIKDMILMAGDWFHKSASMLNEKMVHHHLMEEHDGKHSKHFDGIHFLPPVFESAHINGRGRYTNDKTGVTIEAPLTKYTVQPGSTYRFRVINPGMVYPFRVSIDQHRLTVISTDGYDVQPRSFESIVINPGERYDFLLVANQTSGNYWIRVDGMEVDFPDHNTKGILQYENSEGALNSSRQICSKLNPCYVLNCHFLFYRPETNTICVKIDDLKTNRNEKVPNFDETSLQFIHNWGKVPSGFGINGKIFEYPSINTLARQDDVNMALNCDQSESEDGKVCRCHHEIELPFDKTIQLIFTNHGKGATRHHPIHIHGHSFHVLKLAYGEYNMTSAWKTADNTDINCVPDKLCNNPGFVNSSWRGDIIPGLNLIDPPQKDTIILPSGAYVVLRFRSNNPGIWFMHCHVGFHSMQDSLLNISGMALVLNEAKEHQKLPSSGIPLCQDYIHDSSRDNDDVRIGKIQRDNRRETLLIVALLLAAIIAIQTVAIVIYCLCRRSKYQIKNTKTEYIDMDRHVLT